MGIEETGGKKYRIDEKIEAYDARKKEVSERKIETLSDEEFIALPELVDPVTGGRIVTSVEYLEPHRYGWTEEYEHRLSQIERAYPNNRFVSTVATGAKVFRLPFRYADTFKDHRKRKAWRSSLPGPIGARLAEIMITGNNVYALLKNPFLTAEGVHPEMYQEAEFKKLSARADKLFAIIHPEYDERPPAENYMAVGEAIHFYTELVDWMTDRFPLLETPSPVE